MNSNRVNLDGLVHEDVEVAPEQYEGDSLYEYSRPVMRMPSELTEGMESVPASRLNTGFDMVYTGDKKLLGGLEARQKRKDRSETYQTTSMAVVPNPCLGLKRSRVRYGEWKRRKRIPNIVSQLFDREIRNARPGTITTTSRQVYLNIVPKSTAFDVEVPSRVIIKKFSTSGRTLVCFSRNLKSIILYEYVGHSGAMKEGESISSPSFDSCFRMNSETVLVGDGGVVQKDFCLFTVDEKYVIAASSGPFAPLDCNRPGIVIDDGPNPDSLTCINTTTNISFHIIDLTNGRQVDRITFKNDYIHLTENRGVSLHDDLFSILSVQNQTVYLMKIRDNGTLIASNRIGYNCFEDDEMILKNYTESERIWREMNPDKKGAQTCSTNPHMYPFTGFSPTLWVSRAQAVAEASALVGQSQRARQFSRNSNQNPHPRHSVGHLAAHSVTTPTLPSQMTLSVPPPTQITTNLPLQNLHWTLHRRGVTSQPHVHEGNGMATPPISAIPTEYMMNRDTSQDRDDMMSVSFRGGYTILFPTDDNFRIDNGQINTASPSWISGLKHKLLLEFFKRAQGDREKLTHFRENFHRYCELVMLKMQLFDSQHLWIKYGSTMGIASRPPEQFRQAMYLVLYNFVSGKIISIVDAASEELFQMWIHYSDNFRVGHSSSSYPVSSTQNNVFMRERVKKQRNTALQSRHPQSSLRRIMSALPLSPQSRNPSPYFDQSLFHFDDRLISPAERVRSWAEFGVKFHSRECGSLRFKLVCEPSELPESEVTRRSVHFIAHPVFPFVFSLVTQNVHGQCSVNIHYRE